MALAVCQVNWDAKPVLRFVVSAFSGPSNMPVDPVCPRRIRSAADVAFLRSPAPIIGGEA
jgi:hypothetical protein